MEPLQLLIFAGSSSKNALFKQTSCLGYTDPSNYFEDNNCEWEIQT